jgi:hypothetical protein
VAHDSYLVRMEAILARPGLARATADARWRPSFWGRMLLKGLTSSARLPAPRIYQVGPTPRPLVLKEFLARQERLREFLDRAAGVDWHRTGLVSPVSPLFRMNLGDGFMILVAHADRHRGQMERVRAALLSGGPGAP